MSSALIGLVKITQMWCQKLFDVHHHTIEVSERLLELELELIFAEPA